MTRSPVLTFEPVGDMIGMKLGVLREEDGKRKILVSTAIYSLLQGDEKPAVLERLRVLTDDGVKWVMDL